MTSTAATTAPEHASGRRHPKGRLGALRGPVICGAVVGVIQAVSPLGFWWLEPKTVYALGLAGHGLKDLWQHRTHFVRNTRWWPPFCATVDWVVAGILTGALLMGVPFHG